jgi:hypothetical protein
VRSYNPSILDRWAEEDADSDDPIDSDVAAKRLQICKSIIEDLLLANERNAEDARRWRALLASERIRFVGGADLGTDRALVGFDFHKKHPDKDDEESRKILLAYVDHQSEDD